MSEPESKRGRVRDAEKTRQAILDAAEADFAEHGFAGARIDAIARASGYNQSLLFQYFGDKLGLYAEVLRRIDRQSSELQAQLIEPLLEDETIASDAHRFRAFLTTALGAFFDYMIEHPHIMRMIIWEHANGWQTFAKIASQFETKDIEQLESVFSRARRAGLLRSDFDPVVLLLLAEQICWLYPTSLPYYQMFLPERGISSAIALASAREHIIAFIVAGILVDLPATKETQH
ncbi:MAG TPA: TetR/AcrR family transcriptional regulator [Ktedonobacteraceae bacterium]|nr:TetR/AcrR family transcriptional regulator [Ktedonobacteraceae bacterium]